jgi:hypothetical protein
MSKSRKKRAPKRVLALPDLEQAKSAVLNTLTSVSGQRTYDHAINDFVEWYCSATQTIFRWLAGPLRINLHASAATPAISGTCQTELSKKVSRERLIGSIVFLQPARQQCLNLREFLRGQMSGFYQVQHQAVG